MTSATCFPWTSMVRKTCPCFSTKEVSPFGGIVISNTIRPETSRLGISLTSTARGAPSATFAMSPSLWCGCLRPGKAAGLSCRSMACVEPHSLARRSPHAGTCCCCRRVLDRLDDVLVTRAPAEVAGQGLADLDLAGCLVLTEQCMRAHEHSRGAEPALQAVMRPEGLLQEVQAISAQPFHRGDLRPIGLHGKHQAAPDGLAVQMDRAGATHAVLAPHMRARQRQVAAEEVRQRLQDLDGALVLLTVHPHSDSDALRVGRRLAHATPFPAERAMARVTARSARTPATRRRYTAVACRSLSAFTASLTTRRISAIRGSVALPPTSTASAFGERIGPGPAPKTTRRRLFTPWPAST